jgi:autoinducer 2-degrading protein
MQILLIEVQVKPERRAEFLEVIRDDASHSEHDEPGCLRFDVLQDTENENKFYYYEVYRDEAARAAHRQTPHFARYSQASADMFEGPVVRHVLSNAHPQDDAWR